MESLNETTWQLIQRLFHLEHQQQAADILTSGCSELPFPDHREFLERMQFAMLKHSEGSIEKLRAAVKLAQLDFRDELMAAGFGQSLTAHQEWAQRILKES